MRIISWFGLLLIVVWVFVVDEIEESFEEEEEAEGEGDARLESEDDVEEAWLEIKT
jgi:hypothetical protein